MNQEMAKRLRAKAESLAERVRKGEDLTAVAASIGARTERLTGLTRQGAAEGDALSQEGYAQAFGVASKGVFLAANPAAFAVTIGRVESISSPPAAPNARTVEQVRPQLGMTLFSEIGAQMPRYARVVMKARTEPELARQSLGVETPAAGKEAAGK
jgi:peptidyl-prolyl cis-trans isomerase D